MSKWMGLTVGTLLGGYARYYLSGWTHRWSGPDFPYGTLVVNSIGCLLIGFFSVLAEEKSLLTPEARLCLMTGFCGAFTTFSALILESSYLAKNSQWMLSGLNIALSLAAGIAAYRLGLNIARIL